jgi:hypothetical protein
VDFRGVTIKSVQRSPNRGFNASVNLERLRHRDRRKFLWDNGATRGYRESYVCQ